MIRIQNLYKFFGCEAVINGLNCTIPISKITGLIGPSAGGKSVLMKMLGGVYQPDSGEVDYGHINRSKIDLMFQEGALFDSLSVFDNVAFPLVDGRVPASKLAGVERHEVIEKVSWILARVGLSAAANKLPAQISGGMRRRASLARTLVMRPELALLDDPTAGLDPVASTVIMELILELQRETGTTMLVVSHDLRRLLPICDQVVCLFSGAVNFVGTTATLLAAPDNVKRFISCRYDINAAGQQQL